MKDNYEVKINVTKKSTKKRTPENENQFYLELCLVHYGFEIKFVIENCNLAQMPYCVSFYKSKYSSLSLYGIYKLLHFY